MKMEPRVDTRVHLQDCGLISEGNRTRLNPTTLTLASEQITAVIGPNGAGKSTLMGLISGVVKPTQGRVLLGENVVASTKTQRLAQLRAILSQDQTDTFGFSVQDVVSWARTPWRGTDQQGNDDVAIERALNAVDMFAAAGRPINQLSGGERQRVHLARVMAQDSQLLILDEPDSDLDLVGRNLLDSVMMKLNQMGKTILMSSHDVNRMSRLAQNAVVMGQQSVIFHGPIRQALTSEVLSEAYQSTINVSWTQKEDGAQAAEINIVG